jgi:hypothetical protein
MPWIVIFHPEFEPEFRALPRAVRVELAASAKALEARGPMQGRPLVDTLKGSKHANMKELRFNADDGVWRAAFAFDPEQNAIVLIAGDKSGVSEARFYRSILETADARYDAHLEDVNKRRQKK